MKPNEKILQTGTNYGAIDGLFNAFMRLCIVPYNDSWWYDSGYLDFDDPLHASFVAQFDK